jgi:UDP-glucose 4-epimerase
VFLVKFFVTGGAGFIGSNLVKRLLDDDGEVVVYDNLSTGRKEFVDSRATFIQGDLLDFGKLKESMSGCDMVWHLAANADIRVAERDTRFDIDQGIIATYNVVEAMMQSGIKKLAYSSSSVVYGEAKVMPTPEDYGPLVPISLYAASKLGSEGIICSYCGSFGLTAWIFRFANIIGKNGTHGILTDFLKKVRKNPEELEVLGDGSQRKSYMMVEDCVDAMIYVVGNAKDSVNIFNLGGVDSINVSRITEVFLEKVSPNTKIRYTGGSRGWTGDVRKMGLSIEKLEARGWNPKGNSELAIRKAIDDILAQEKALIG